MADLDQRPKTPAQEFERFLDNLTEAEVNAWAVRTLGGDRYKVMVWLVSEVRRLRAEVAELKVKKGR